MFGEFANFKIYIRLPKRVFQYLCFSRRIINIFYTYNYSSLIWVVRARIIIQGIYSCLVEYVTQILGKLLSIYVPLCAGDNHIMS